MRIWLEPEAVVLSRRLEFGEAGVSLAGLHPPVNKLSRVASSKKKRSYLLDVSILSTAVSSNLRFPSWLLNVKVQSWR